MDTNQSLVSDVTHHWSGRKTYKRDIKVKQAIVKKMYTFQNLHVLNVVKSCSIYEKSDNINLHVVNF